MTLLDLRKRHLDAVLQKAVSGYSLSSQEIVFLLSLESPKDIQRVMTTAQKLREQYFGNRIFVYGFIYFSTYCRNHCAFCYYRSCNELSPRYRKSLAEVADIALGLADSGVHLIDLTMGEDPQTHETNNYDILFEMIDRVKRDTGLPVMISPGVVPDETLQGFSRCGVDWYALYQETHNPVLYSKLRVGQSFEERCAKRDLARRKGLLVEDGILLGVGETTADRANSIMNMKREMVHQARVMSLVPQPQTPLAGRVPIPRFNEYLFISVMRLVMPDRLIPASLDVDGIKGLKMRLEAGANVVTSIIPPSSSLAGVSQSTLDIDEGFRTVPEVGKVLAGMGLEVAPVEEYTKWILGCRQKMAEWGESHDQDRYCGRTASGFGSGISGRRSGI